MSIIRSLQFIVRSLNRAASRENRIALNCISCWHHLQIQMIRIDPKTKVRGIQALLQKEKCKDRPATESGNLLDPRRRHEARARRSVFQETLNLVRAALLIRTN